MTTCVLSRDQAGEYERLFVQHPGGLIQRSTWWADIVSPLLGDVPYFIIVRNADEVVAGLPLYHFEGPRGGILTSVPHAGPLGGILVHPRIGPKETAAMFDALLERAFSLARDLSCRALTIISDPFTGDAGLYLGHRPAYVLKNFCQGIFLRERFLADGSYSAGQSAHNNDVRRNLRKATEAGVVVNWENAGAIDAWIGIHRERHLDLGVRPLPEELLRKILSVLAPLGRAGLAVARVDGRAVGGCLYVWHGEIADVFIMSSDTGWIAKGVNYALTEFSLKYFHSQGLRIYNWQSSVPGSGVFSFKERWGSRVVPYDFLTWTFPGFERFLAASPEDIRREYAWHYVAPYPALEGRLAGGVFQKGT